MMAIININILNSDFNTLVLYNRVQKLKDNLLTGLVIAKILSINLNSLVLYSLLDRYMQEVIMYRDKVRVMIYLTIRIHLKYGQKGELFTV
jgi:hypothetical protein